MGDLQIYSPRPNGGVVFSEDRLNLSSPSSLSVPSATSSPPFPATHPDPSSIPEESWMAAEEATNHIIYEIRPTMIAEQKRTAVIDYVQRLIRGCLGCEVFAYGSVPLKTYLPDGDIDLTAISSPNFEDALVSDVHAVLMVEEHNEASQYEVKDVHYIDAEVKLVKCIIENIVVDISFNQLGGLSTLCFLEQIDSLVGRDHLFKRSIILIKAWCYYESRILGAHHGLISTYALETLVLYIFHIFHSSLNGPLSVLYKFLDYFSKFDWDNYFVSLNGPVCKYTVPDRVADISENGGDDLLLSEDFLRSCVDMYTLPAKGVETNSRIFPQKHLNIIDPLRESNNLGRSVNKGNFFRVRSAFKYGARKLCWILMLPRERIANELQTFFSNTLGRHGSTYEYDIQNPAQAYGGESYEMSLPSSFTEMCSNNAMLIKSSTIMSRSDLDAGRNVSQSHLSENSKEFTPCTLLGLRSKDESSNCCPTISACTLDSGTSRHFTGLFRENGKIDTGMLANAKGDNEKLFTSGLESAWPNDYQDSETPSGSAVPRSANNVLGSSSHGLREKVITGMSGSTEALESLVDFNGDHDSHLRNLKYGQHCHAYNLSVPIIPSPPMSFPLQIKNPGGTPRRSVQLKHNVSSQINKNSVVSGPLFYSVNPSTLSNGSFGLDEKRKHRGTGTYFPNMNYQRPTDERPSQGRGKNQVTALNIPLKRNPRNNDFGTLPREMNSESNRELSQEEFPVLGCGRPISADSYRTYPSIWGPSHANGFSCSSQNLANGSRAPLPENGYSTEGSNEPDPSNATLWTSVSSPKASPELSPKSELDNSQERIVEQSYRLKDEDDFPPLSV